MATLGDLAIVRSKTAGPFVLPLDVFSHSADAFAIVARILTTDTVATALGCNITSMTEFVLPDLHVLKFSLPRPTVQGSPTDRAMHGAQFAVLLAELPLPEGTPRPVQ